jgi:hypothetical protein
VTPSRLVAWVLVAGVAAAQTQERIDTYENGTLKARWLVDGGGRKHGAYTAYHPNGVVALKTVYRDDALDGSYQTFHANRAPNVSATYARGQLSGPYEEASEDGARIWTATWVAGKLQGDAKLSVRQKPLITQKWRDGVLSQMNGFTPHPTYAADIRTKIERILALPAPAGAVDPKGPERWAALRRLQSYRYLCGVPWEEMTLEPAWNDLCDAASEVCEKLGYLSHTPPDPGGLPPGRYEQGRQGAGHSNLSMGSDMPGSVDGYMDDSDPSNVARLGHRRWCLLPEMRRTGFGSANRWSAMWTGDRSAPSPKGLKTVKYPPAGYVPSDFFGSQHAWTIAFVTGPWSAQVAPKAIVEPLDDRYLPSGAPLECRTWIVASGYGSSRTVAFLPSGVSALPGFRYLVSLSLDRGATRALQYVVEFVDPVGKPAEAPR